MMKLYTSFWVLVAMGMSSWAQDILCGWEVKGISAEGAMPAVTIHSSLKTGQHLNELSRSGLTAPDVKHTYASFGWNVTDKFDQGRHYISFRVAPASGEIVLTDLQYNIGGAGNAPGMGRWGYSVDGKNWVLQEETTLKLFKDFKDPVVWDFDDFSAVGEVEFRFWAYGEKSINGQKTSKGGQIRIFNGDDEDLILHGHGE